MKLTNYLLKPETTLAGKLGNIGFAFTLCFIWVLILKLFLNNLAGMEIIGQYFPFLQPQQQPKPAYLFFESCILPPLWEELCWRYVPISVAMYFCRKYNDYTLLLPVIVASSINFGWGHGSGEISVILQGVMGFIFACLYVKNNFSYWSSVLVHATWNTMVMLGFRYFIS